MTTTATITQLRVPQTVTVPFGATTPVRFDALLEMVTSVISPDTSSGECCGMMETAAFKAAHDALWTFADDCVTNDHAIVREFAMALATMMSTERLSLEDSIDVAHYVNQLSMQNDLPAFIDWSARERHARHTASLMFALIHKRQMLTVVQQHTINERLKSAEALAVQTLTENRALLEEVTEALMAERELDILQIRVLTGGTNGTLRPGQIHEGLFP